MRRLVIIFSLIALAGCAKPSGQLTVGGSSSMSGGVIGVQTFTTPMPAGKQLVDPVHGTETGLAYAAVNGENGTLANGVATAHYFQDGSTNIGVQVNITVAKPGTHYEAWLVNADASKTIDMGILQNAANDVRYGITYDSKETLTDYTKIAVTVQQDGGSKTSGSVVADATLKPTSR